MIRPPRRRCFCHCRAAISTVAHSRYPPDADPGHARRRVRCRRRRRRRPLPLCPPLVAAGGTQPLRQLARRRRPWGGGMRSALLDVVVVVTVAPRSPPSPITGIRQTRTPDTPVDVFDVTAVVDVALSPPCPPPVAGQVRHVQLLPPRVVVVSTSSRERQRHSPWRRTTTRCRPLSTSSRPLPSRR